MRSEFDEWLLDNYGFEADIQTPILYRPPLFVDGDGMFNVVSHDQWVEDMYEGWKKNVND